MDTSDASLDHNQEPRHKMKSMVEDAEMSINDGKHVQIDTKRPRRSNDEVKAKQSPSHTRPKSMDIFDYIVLNNERLSGEGTKPAGKDTDASNATTSSTSVLKKVKSKAGLVVQHVRDGISNHIVKHDTNERRSVEDEREQHVEQVERQPSITRKPLPSSP